GVCVLFDGRSLQPVAFLEGAGLTALRTPAMTALAVKHLAPVETGRVALFGTGVQARGHVEALLAVFRPTNIAVVGRNSERAQTLSEWITSLGIGSTVEGPEA